MEIAQNAKKVVFCGTFDAQGSQVAWRDGALRIERAGAVHKLVAKVAKITFAAEYARQRGQTVLYITERAVFRLTPDGIELIEIAPGIEIERDILPAMEFRPIIREVRRMDASVFA